MRTAHHPYVSCCLAAALIAFGASSVSAQSTTKAPSTPAEAAQKAGEKKTSTNPSVNPDAEVMADFKARVDKYLSIHKQAATGPGALKQTDEAGDIKKAQLALAARIRALRADAKPADIFTPAIRAKFRRLLSPQTRGEDGRDAKEVIEYDAPASAPLKVNAAYPEGKPLPSVPTTYLLNLPSLPKPLEYRIIDKHLILLDTDASLIVDYMTNVVG